MVFCTYFDSNYLDKGLVMYRSLRKHTPEVVLYILPMDEKCLEVLNGEQDPKITIVDPEVFLDKTGLREIRKERRRAEFYWTCTSYLIDYVLTEYGEKECTYVDADLRFYSDPGCLTAEMKEKNVQIVRHGFDRTPMGLVCKATSGTYCVQFNTFRNEESSLQLLRWWEKQCFDSCSNGNMEENGVFGDQGYLETWGEKENVSVLENPGAGVAPWNAYQYKVIDADVENDRILLKKKGIAESFSLVFYHFHNIAYYSAHKVDICAYQYGEVDPEIVRRIYLPYLKELDDTKIELREKYGVYPLLESHPGKGGSEEKKSILQHIFSIDRLFFPKLYLSTVGRIKAGKRTGKNIIEF